MPELQAILPSFTDAPGFDTGRFLEAHALPSVNSFRINHKKIQQPPFSDTYAVPWCEDGYYSKSRPAYAQHPFWHGGAIYVQEASSMFLHYVLKQILPLKNKCYVLDACAAPGGKSTLIASLLNEASVLVSNEVINSRVRVLEENVIKWGNHHSIITSSDSQNFSKLDQLFDCIVVDAPCSGSGLFRKDADAMNEWSESNVQLCSDRQQRILANLIPALKNLGYLVYSTCSFSVSENEAMVNWLCEEHALEAISLPVPESWQIVASQQGCYRFYPYNLEGEGFFLSVLKKKGEEAAKDLPFNKTLKMIKPDALMERYVKPGYYFFTHNDLIFAATASVLEVTEQLKKVKINLIRCGVETGQVKGNKFIPAHALALNEALHPETVSVTLNEADAMNYLRKQTIQIDAPKGFTIVKYQEVNLGWINMLNDRCNNLYPTNWRLLH